MKRIGRRPFLIGSSLLGACGGVIADEPQPQPSPTPTPEPDEPPAPSPPEPPRGYCRDRAPESAMRALHGIGNFDPYPRGTLYSFTTSAQAAELRKGAPVFSKSTSDSGYRGFLFDVLEQAAAAGSEAARLLAGPIFEKGRFAWPFLAGTRISPEDYGDEILAFTLRPEARIAAVDSKGNVGFRDAENSGLYPDQALSEPERIGAIYFFNDSQLTFSTLSDTICPRDTLAGALVYREFYLGSLAMVEEWSLGTQAILDHLADEVADLRGLAKSLDCTDGGLCDQIVRSWDQHPGDNRLDQLLASLAFAPPPGRSGLMPSALSALADDLESLRFEPDPLVVRP